MREAAARAALRGSVDAARDAALTPDQWAALVPVVVGGLLAVGGGVVAGWFGYLAAKSQAKAALNLDSAKRGDDRQLRREDIQRETLLELQTALNDWMRATALLHRQDIRDFRERGQLSPYGPELDAPEFETRRRLIFLSERVIDDELRQQLRGLIEMEGSYHTRYLSEGSREDLKLETLQADDHRFALASGNVQTTLGVVLRKYLTGRE